MLQKMIRSQKRYVNCISDVCLSISSRSWYLHLCGDESSCLPLMLTELLISLLQTIKRMIFNIKPKDIGSIITGSPGEDPKMLANFKDLLEKIFVLDPDKRMTVSQALTHPFITGK
jgi:serine/threonine protein kinase